MSSGQRITAEEVSQSPDLPHGRVAVVLIHGIGDQHPMNTLRDFINGLYPSKNFEPHVFSKPDRISDVLDLRRMAAGPDVTGNATDFYELYWAHLMQGSTLAHVGDWFFMLLLRLPIDVPERLRKLWLISWIVVFGAGIYAVFFALKGNVQEALLSTGLVGLILYVTRGLFRKIALCYLADAARYLRPTPENIGIRQAIRNAGLEVLRNLHDEPMQRYDRIVIVGHSLGSVIAYDILTHLWQEMHWLHAKPNKPEQPQYESMRNYLVDLKGQAGERGSFCALQKELLKEEQGLGMPWKVTDLITMGSPLAYADYLLADRHYGLVRREQDRELPTCPPQLEDNRDVGFLSPSYVLPDGTLAQKKLLHHAALFACTRWTNIYFQSDIIGGKLAPLFGNGIKDVTLSGDTRSGNSLLSHVMYWHEKEKTACAALKSAMCLCELKEVPHC